MRGEITKVWITKYALTKGIFELEVDSCGGEVVNGADSLEPYYKDDWRKTKEEALLRANFMRANEINYLKNQIEKLEKMKFE